MLVRGPVETSVTSPGRGSELVDEQLDGPTSRGRGRRGRDLRSRRARRGRAPRSRDAAASTRGRSAPAATSTSVRPAGFEDDEGVAHDHLDRHVPVDAGDGDGGRSRVTRPRRGSRARRRPRCRRPGSAVCRHEADDTGVSNVGRGRRVVADQPDRGVGHDLLRPFRRHDGVVEQDLDRETVHHRAELERQIVGVPSVPGRWKGTRPSGARTG